MRTKLLATLSSVAVSAATLTLVATPASAADRDVVLPRGHIDAFEVTYDSAAAKLVLSLGDDTRLFSAQPVFRDPASVVIHADSPTMKTTTDGLPPAYAFLGGPGRTIYLIPQSQDQTLPWPGWSTERLRATLPDVSRSSSLSPADSPVLLDLEIDGPGAVHAFANNAFGGVINRYVDTTDDKPEQIPVGSNNHVHTNWVFTEPGSYTMTVTPTARLTAGGTVTGDAKEYVFHVGAPTNTVAPSITGEPAVGSVLTATPGTWTPAAAGVTGQWLRNGEPIAGADKATYTVATEDKGAKLTYRSSARLTESTARADSDVVTIPLDPAVATSAPVVSGSFAVGKTLQASPGTWNADGLAFSYQWMRDGQPIAGATGTSLALSAADHRRGVSVQVTATGALRPAASAVSAARAIGTGAKLRYTTKPKITGSRKVGRTLKVSPGRWSPAATSYTYRWKANGKTIKGATKRTLKLKKAQKGKRITVTVTAKRTGHASGTASRSVGTVK